MTKYEVMYIVRPNLDEDALQKAMADMSDAFTSTGAQVLETLEMGLKDLAYEIEHERKGYYVWLNVNADGASVAEFNRRANINENVIRHIVVLDERKK